MKQKSIIFKTEMVEAILAGNKTQTRRVIKGNPNIVHWNPIMLNGYAGWTDEHGRPMRAQYEAGDLLLVKGVSGVLLEVKDVRAERLNDISGEDAISEGIAMDGSAYRLYMGKAEIKEWADSGIRPATLHPVESFRSLWKSTHGNDSWNKNPWVFVYTFKILEESK